MSSRLCVGTMLLAGLACAAGLVCSANAQQATTMQLTPAQPQSSGPMATVTGHVTCSDTQKPARFANVWLVPAEEASGTQGQMNFGRRAGGRTDLNGDFTLQTEPGDYYVTATASGYISPVTEAAARLGSGASEADLLASLPEVHVSDTGGGPANITLDRGGVIAGKLQWEDGSPASGVNVVAVSNAANAANSTAGGSNQLSLNRVLAMLGGFGGGGGGFQMTDDRGNFRLTGLAPGSYVVRATLMTPSAEPSRGFGERMASVTMYAPGKVRRGDAQVLTLKSGEERDDVAFTIDLTQMHTISGHVSSDGSGTIESGTVRLTDATDSTLTRSAQIQQDGSFVVQWVPSGNYTLSVSNASTQPANFGYRGGGDSGSSAQTFQPFQESLTVTDADMTGVAVSLPAAGSQ